MKVMKGLTFDKAKWHLLADAAAKPDTACPAGLK
jgi:hypothetical protein